jgi:hypothetical protein
MRFDDPTLYGRDDETDEYSDSGAYGESLEEDLEEEEEEEEEPVLVEEDDEIITPGARTGASCSIGWWRRRERPKKKAPAKKKARSQESGQKAGEKSGQKTGSEKEGQTGEEESAKKAPRSRQRKRQRKNFPQETLAVSKFRANPWRKHGGSPASASQFWLPPFPTLFFVLNLFSVRHDRFRFDLHQHLRRNQRRDRHHRARGTNVAEKFSVRFSYFFPIRNIGEEHAGAHYVFHRSSGAL